MSISQRLFAAWYDILNSTVEGRLASYRDQTAGHSWGDVLEIGGGTGANLAFYPKDINLTVIEPNPHMAKRFRKRARKLGRDVTIVPDVVPEAIPSSIAARIAAIYTARSWCMRKLSRMSSLAVR